MSVDKTLEDIYVLTVFNSEVSVAPSHPGDFTLITIQIMPKPKEWSHVSWLTQLICFTRIQLSLQLLQNYFKKCLKFQFHVLFVTV